jgi:peptidoglycan/LPS O-acetylase OafA/YrhL
MLSGLRLPGGADAIVWDFVTYAACWIAGFAHQDGRLARIPLPALVGLVGGLGVAGGGWLLTHPGPDGMDLNEVPVARALWSLAFVLAVLRWRPALGWLDRARPLSAAVRLINARAVTIYLWHFPLISLAGILLTALTLNDIGPWTGPLLLTTVGLFTAAAVAAFGWVEDLAANRRPAVWPLSRRAHPARGEPPTEPAVQVIDATDTEPAFGPTPS